MDNCTIARQLLATARSLQEKQSNLYRVQAYRRAAQTIMGLNRPIEDLVASAGRKALRELPGIGAKLSVKIETLGRTGDITALGEDAAVAVVK
jgi:DNA polymerase/3'-5' exonuclease PolX